MYLCRRYSMLEWWCNLLMNNHNNTGYPLICRLLSNNYSCVFYLLHWDRITFENKSNYDKKNFTIYMARLSFSLAFNMPHFPYTCYTWIWFVRSNQYLLRTDNRGKSFCAYKFSAEKGIAKGILFFIFAISCDIFFCILIFLILYSLS